jgi:hypothetical protein
MLKRGPVKIWPEGLAEVQLGIGQLPKQEVTDALFAASSNE